MFKLALVALLCAQAFVRPQEAEIDPQIIGGIKAKEGEFPYAVSVRQLNNATFCGGVLISDRYVLTAAHCVADKKPVKIGAGSVNLNSQTLYEVDKIIVHPKFDVMSRNQNDVGLLRLKNPIKLGGNIQTINFPVTENLEGKTGTATGWGRTDPDGTMSQALYYLNRPFLSNQECSNRTNFRIRDGEVCLMGEVNKGVCYGDGGNPLLYKAADGKNYIAGMASWGVAWAKGYPDVFVRVSYYADWIKKNMV